MSECKYGERLKCKDCKFILPRQCKLFVTARAKDAAKALLPFVYSSKFKPKGKVMWSKDVNRAKSLAVQCALQHNFNIRKYSLSQIVSLALNGESVEDIVVYVDCSQKLNGDVEKLKGVLNSFIESALLNNTCFVIYVAPTVSMVLDYNKI